MSAARGKRRRAFFAGYLPWRPLLPAALVAAATFSLELTLLAESDVGALWSASLALAIGTLVAWGEARGADRGRIELALQLSGRRHAWLGAGPRASLLLLVTLSLALLARSLGAAALPLGSGRAPGGPTQLDVLALGVLAFSWTQGLARAWTLRRGAARQDQPRDHLFALPGALAALGLALLALRGEASPSWDVWPLAAAGAALLLAANAWATRRHGTDVCAVLEER